MANINYYSIILVVNIDMQVQKNINLIKFKMRLDVIDQIHFLSGIQRENPIILCNNKQFNRNVWSSSYLSYIVGIIICSV